MLSELCSVLLLSAGDRGLHDTLILGVREIGRCCRGIQVEWSIGMLVCKVGVVCERTVVDWY